MDITNTEYYIEANVGGNGEGFDDITFDKKDGTLNATAFSYEIASSGFVEISQNQTRAIYEEMKKFFEKEDNDV